MKLRYLTLLLPGIALLVLTAGCGGKTETTTVDSSVDSAEVEEEEELEEFSSPDLGLWNLTGPVAGASFTSEETNKNWEANSKNNEVGLDSITFNRQGLVTSFVSGSYAGNKLTPASDLEFTYNEQGEFTSGNEKMAKEHGNSIFVKLSRSSGGYLQMLQLLGPDKELSNSDTYVRLFEWANGLLFYDTLEQGGEGTVRVKYSYNIDGFPDKVVSTIADMGGETKIEDEYEYTDFDRYGNWTERRVTRHITDTESEADGTNATTKKSTTYQIDRRKIYYYPPEGSEPATPRQLLRREKT